MNLKELQQWQENRLKEILKIDNELKKRKALYQDKDLRLKDFLRIKREIEQVEKSFIETTLFHLIKEYGVEEEEENLSSINIDEPKIMNCFGEMEKDKSLEIDFSELDKIFEKNKIKYIKL